MMKRILAVLVCCMMCIGAAPAECAERPVHIVFWHSMSDRAGQLVEEFVKDFNAGPGAEKGIVAEAVYQGKYSDATTKMNNMINAGTLRDLPDVMNLDSTGKLNYAASGAAWTVDQAAEAHPEWDLSRYLSVAMANWQMAGAQLGIPFAVSTTVLYGNASLISPLPETLDGIAALAGGTGEAAVFTAVPDTPTLANWLGQLGSDVVNGGNGNESTATALACLDNGTLLTFLNAWKQLYASGALVNASASTDEFVTGKTALMLASSSKITDLLTRIDGRFELAVGYYPKVSEDASFGATVSGSCLVMFDSGDDSRKDAALELVRYLTSAEVQAAFAAGTGYTPCCTDAIATEAWQQLIAAYPQYQVCLDQLAKTPAEMKSVTVGPAVDFYYAIQNDIMDMLDEDLSPEETAELLAADLQGLLDQYLRNNPL